MQVNFFENMPLRERKILSYYIQHSAEDVYKEDRTLPLRELAMQVRLKMKPDQIAVQYQEDLNKYLKKHGYFNLSTAIFAPGKSRGGFVFRTTSRQEQGEFETTFEQV
jgi:hypothetical protein